MGSISDLPAVGSPESNSIHLQVSDQINPTIPAGASRPLDDLFEEYTGENDSLVNEPTGDLPDPPLGVISGSLNDIVSEPSAQNEDWASEADQSDSSTGGQSGSSAASTTIERAHEHEVIGGSNERSLRPRDIVQSNGKTYDRSSEASLGPERQAGTPDQQVDRSHVEETNESGILKARTRQSNGPRTQLTEHEVQEAGLDFEWLELNNGGLIYGAAARAVAQSLNPLMRGTYEAVKKAYATLEERQMKAQWESWSEKWVTKQMDYERNQIKQELYMQVDAAMRNDLETRGRTRRRTSRTEPWVFPSKEQESSDGQNFGNRLYNQLKERVREELRVELLPGVTASLRAEHKEWVEKQARQHLKNASVEELIATAQDLGVRIEAKQGKGKAREEDHTVPPPPPSSERPRPTRITQTRDERTRNLLVQSEGHKEEQVVPHTYQRRMDYLQSASSPDDDTVTFTEKGIPVLPTPGPVVTEQTSILDGRQNTHTGLADRSEPKSPEQTEDLITNRGPTDRQSPSIGSQGVLTAGNKGGEDNGNVDQEISSNNTSQIETKHPRPDPLNVDQGGPRSRTTAGQRSTTSNVTTSEAKDKPAQKSKSGSSSAAETPYVKSTAMGTRTQLPRRFTQRVDNPASPSARGTKRLKRHHGENDIEEKDGHSRTLASPAKKARRGAAAANTGKSRGETVSATPSAPAPAVKEAKVEKRKRGRPFKGKGRDKATAVKRK